MNRVATGVAGLDVVLNGGLEPGAVVVLAGAPGTGKTILAQQLTVVKMRNSPREMTLNRYDITAHGLAVGGQLEGVTGRLGWNALRTQMRRPPGGAAARRPVTARTA